MLLIDVSKTLYRIITRKTQSILVKIHWKKKNPHNYTNMENIFDISAVEVGKGTYGGLRVINYSNVPNLKLNIGDYCSIGGDVTFLLGAEHNLNTFSTYPFKARIIAPNTREAGSKGSIILRDDVWIGHGSTILSGVTIGQGAVVAAGSLVNKDIPPYAIVGGVPARIIKYRFSQEIIKKLITFDFNRLDTTKIKLYKNELYYEITEENINHILQNLSN